MNNPPSGNNSASANAYYAIGHNSLPNYLSVWSGRLDGVIGQGCSSCATCATITDGCLGGVQAGPWNGNTLGAAITYDNVVREMIANGTSWKSYAENLPTPSTACGSGLYAQRHNPPVFFTDVTTSGTQAAKVVNFNQFATDVSNNALPQVSLVVPNTCDDAHDASCGGLPHADSWLKTNVIDVLATSTAFQAGGRGVLIVTFDEGTQCAPASCCPAPPHWGGGGQIVFTLTGPVIKPNYSSTTTFQHPSLTRLIIKGTGGTHFPGDSATAADMGEFFR